jgi:molybdate transport system permease protein
VRHLFSAVAAACLAALLAFLLLPVAAVLIRVPPGSAWWGEVALDALRVTLLTSLVANLVFLLLGTPAAYLVATRRFRGRALVVTLLEVPLVLPPAVAGIGLLVAFGRAGILGRELSALGLEIPFTRLAVVLAVVFVAAPLYVRQAVAAFEAVDAEVLAAARTLGAGPFRVFRRVALPMAAGGLAAGWALAFARGIGEFGATIIFAGSLQGVTQTLPLAIYAQFEQDLDTALAIGGLLIAFSLLLLFTAKMVPGWTRLRSTSTSTSRAGTSA